jgi:hypothetical protein
VNCRNFHCVPLDDHARLPDISGWVGAVPNLLIKVLDIHAAEAAAFGAAAHSILRIALDNTI